jgi:hypothetical protein
MIGQFELKLAANYEDVIITVSDSGTGSQIIIDTDLAGVLAFYEEVVFFLNGCYESRAIAGYEDAG